MANKPIKISILADAGKAAKEITKFSETVDENTHRVVTGLGDSKLQGGFGKVQEGFDVLDTRAMGFRDTITGVQDSMTAFKALTTSTATAQQNYNDAVAKYGKDSQEAKAAQDALNQSQATMGDKLLLLGTGVGDLASGFANFLIPMAAMATSLPTLTTGFRALNLTMLANPIFLVIAAIVALVAVFVIAYKKSETFRNLVDGLWGTIKRVFSAIPGFVGKAISGASRLLLAWPKFVIGIYAKAGSWLLNAGKNVVQGFWNGIQSMGGWIRDKITGFFSAQVDSVKRFLHIGSPSRLFKVLGKWTMQGYGDGVEQRATVERGRVQRSFTAVSNVGLATPRGSAGRSDLLSVDAAAVGDPVVRAIIKELQKAGRVQGSLGVA